MKKILLGTMILMVLGSSQIFARVDEVNIDLNDIKWGLGCRFVDGNNDFSALDPYPVSTFRLNGQIMVNFKFPQTRIGADATDASDDNWANGKVTKVVEAINFTRYEGTITAGRGAMFRKGMSFLIILDGLKSDNKTHAESTIYLNDEEAQYPAWAANKTLSCEFIPINK